MQARFISLPGQVALLLGLLLPALALASGIQNDLGVQVIPRPTRVSSSPANFVIKPATRILVTTPAARPAADLLHSHLKEITDLDLPRATIAEPGASNVIRVILNDDMKPDGPEHYRLEITPAGVALASGSPAGLVNGIQTIRQLLPIQRIVGLPRELIEWRLPCVTIEDSPRFGWRGLMLDCSRTFQSVDYLKKTIDRMAFYKLNVLHLHLTDDQGWRIEIRSHPELTVEGSRFPDKWNEPPTHQGFYTQAQLKDLVGYAAARNITIVPEIEMPGHTLALLACHPEFSCTGGPFEIHPFFKGPGIHQDILCAGNDEVFRFLAEVLGEVCEIFPSEFIHIGGDEAPKERWKQCEKCQARIRHEHLANEQELQSWFIEQVSRILKNHGRKVIGWDEILEGGLAPGAAVMSWRGTKGGIAAAKAGHPVVMSPTSHCYFDYPYKRIDTYRAFQFDPLAGIAEDHTQHVLGIQANFWSHIDREPQKVDAQLFPRLLAIAERAWSTDRFTDWDEFSWRVKLHLARLDEMGVSYHRGPLAPPGTPGSGGHTVGRWSPRLVSEDYHPLTWDVSDHISKPGPYRVTFDYQLGAHRLGIEEVALLVDGKVVSRDRHRGMTGHVDQDNSYDLNLKTFKEGARYALRASARSEGGRDSYGVVTLRSAR